MRSLLISVCLIAFGVLAALPFRRVPDRSAHDIHAADRLGENITPLSEAPLVTADTPRERPIAPVRFASVAQPPANPYAPWLEDRPESYQEVAVPLALPGDEGNIFNSGSEERQVLERFGIPDTLHAAERRAAERTALRAAEPWEVEQPIPALQAASALTSVLENEPTPKAGEVLAVASRSPAADSVEPTPEESAPKPRKRMFIREPGR